MSRFTPELRKEIAEHAKLALPMALAQLAQVALQTIDTIMCGRLGPQAIAGVGLGANLFGVIGISAIGFMMAVGPMVAQAYGAKDEATIAQATKQGLWLSVFVGVPIMAILYHGGFFLRMMGQEAHIVDLTDQYLHAVIWGLIPFYWVIVLRGFFDNISRPRIGLIVSLSGIVFNIAGNWILMFGKFGFPALGVAGTGYATSLVNWGMFGVMVFILMKDPETQKFGILKQVFKVNWAYQKNLIQLGAPISAALLLEISLFAGVGFMMGLFSATSLAAHQIALNVASVTFMFALGIAFSTTTRVGQAIGAEDLAGAKRAGLIGMGLGLAVQSVSALAFILIPKPILSLYLDLSESNNVMVIEVATTFLVYAAMFQLFDALQVVSAGALRGLKDTKTPAVVSFFAYGCIGLVGSVLFGFWWGFREAGLWFGFIMGLGVASIILSYQFFQRFKNPDKLLEYQRLAND